MTTTPWSLNVLAYNVQAFPTPLQYCLGLNVTSDRLRDIAASAPFADHDHDLVVFTEAFSRSASRALCKDLHSLGYHYAVKPRYSCRAPLSNGILIALRTPILHHETIFFKTAVGYDWLAAKGFTYVETFINGFNIGIIGTHLQSDAGPKYVDVRIQQLRQIREFIDNSVDHDRISIVIIAGDLNIDYTSVEFDEMLQVLGAVRPEIPNPQSYDPSTNQIARRFDPDAATLHLDYVLLIRGPSKATVVNRTLTTACDSAGMHLSDHHPIHGVVEATVTAG